MIRFLTALLLLFVAGSSATAQIVRIDNNLIRTDSSRLQASIDLNMHLVRNNQQFFQLSSGTQLSFTKQRHTFISMNEIRLILAGSDNFDNRGFQHLRYRIRQDSVLSWEVFSQIQFDQVLNIRLRLLNGAGPRIQLLRKTKNRFFLAAIYMYEYEEEIGTGRINRQHRKSSYLTYARDFKRSQLHFICYYQPDLTAWKDYRISSSLSWSILLGPNLRFNVIGELTYDSRPVAGVTDLIYAFTNGFSWTF